jgi:hypothetical protein
MIGEPIYSQKCCARASKAWSSRPDRDVIAHLAIATAFITGLVLWDPLGHLPVKTRKRNRS